MSNYILRLRKFGGFFKLIDSLKLIIFIVLNLYKIGFRLLLALIIFLWSNLFTIGAHLFDNFVVLSI